MINANTANLDLNSFINKPYGAFKKFVQQNIDPDYGQDTSTLKTYEVDITIEKTCYKKVLVEAHNTKEAEEKAEENYDNDEYDIDDYSFDINTCFSAKAI